jgi:predicted component of viral defense system (DUF524 family)
MITMHSVEQLQTEHATLKKKLAKVENDIHSAQSSKTLQQKIGNKKDLSSDDSQIHQLLTEKRALLKAIEKVEAEMKSQLRDKK